MIKKGGEPTQGSATIFWKPKPDGQNIVVLLSDPLDLANSNDQVRMFQQNKFGKSYPVNMTWDYLGPNQDDPKDTLAPTEKTAYAALVWVSYKVGDEWKLGAWMASKPVHLQLYNQATTNDVINKAISITKIGKNWQVTPASKVKVTAEMLAPAEEIENHDIEKLFGVYPNAEAIWGELARRMELNSREEVMAAFGVVDSDTELM